MSDAVHVLRSTSPEETEAIGAALGAELEAGALVALDGELGAGKTAFVRGVARGLGVEEPVTSPSFTLMHEYRGRLTVRHFDAWMTGREEAFLDGGGAEEFEGDGVAILEWATRVERFLPADRLEVVLEHRGPTERRLTLRVLGAGRPDLLRALAAAVRAAPPGDAAGAPPEGRKP